MDAIDIQKVGKAVDTGVQTSVVWFHSKKEDNKLNWSTDPDELWEGETDNPNIRFDIMKHGTKLYHLNVYVTIFWGPEDEYQMDLTDYTYVDSLEDGYSIAEQIYQSIKKGF